MIPVERLNAWGDAWAAAMTRSVVETSVILAVVLLIWLPWRKRLSAQLGYGLFCLVLLRLVIPHDLPWSSWLSTVSLAAPGTVTAPHDPTLAASPEPFVVPATGDLAMSLSEPAEAPDAVRKPQPRSAGFHKPAAPASRPSLTAMLMLAWAATAVVLLLNLFRAVWQTRRLIQAAFPVDPAWLPIDVAALERTLGVRSPVRWAVSPRITTPAVGGLVRPTVLIPPDLGDELTPNQLTWVLLHELAHIRRADLWVVMAQRVLQAVFFFHPAVHVANSVIDQLREYACDDTALAACQTSRRDCGEGFLTVVERGVERPAAVAALGLFESRMLIRRRLVRILDPRRKVHGRLSPQAAAALVASSVVVVTAGIPDAWAHSQGLALPRPAQASNPFVLDVEEPLTFGPGESWHRELAAGEARSLSARLPVLALAYSPDGSALATAAEDGVIIVRNLRSDGRSLRLEGHRDAVAALAFSPGGTILASAGFDRTVRLWNALDGRPLAVLNGHSNWVFAVAFAADGKTLASAGHDRTVRLWDVASRREVGQLRGHSASVRAVAFAADGTTLASAGADRTIILWDLVQRSLRTRLEGHRGTVRALAFAPGDSAAHPVLASAGEDGEVRLWDTTVGAERFAAVLAGHTDMVVCLAFSPRGTTLASGGLDAVIKLWDTHRRRERATLRGHDDGVSAVAFAPEARQLATGGFDGAVRLWEPSAPVFSPASYLAPAGATAGLAFAPDGRTLVARSNAGAARWDLRTGAVLASVPPAEPSPAPSPSTRQVLSPDRRFIAEATEAGALRVLDARTGRIVAEWRGHPGGIAALAFAADGRTVASGGRDGLVSLWDVARGRQAAVLRGHAGAVVDLAYSRDGRSVAAACAEGTVTLWNLGISRRTAWATLRGEGSCPWAVAYTPDGRTLAVADGPARAFGSIALWDIATRRVRTVIEGHDRGVIALAVSADGQTIASGGFDQTVRISNLTTGESRTLIAGIDGVVTGLALSPDGKVLATAGETGSVALWDVETGDEMARLSGVRGRVRAVAFSPDGALVAAAGGVFENGSRARGDVKVWNVTTKQPLAGFEGATRPVVALAFTPDGTRLAAGGHEQAVRVWNVADGRSVLAVAGLPACVQALGFSPDGSRLAWSGHAGGVVAVLDAETGAEASRLVGHTGSVLGLAFAPDGAGLATTSADKTIKLWDLPASGD